MSNIPTNLSLYNKVKSEAKKKFKVWPSAYASGWLVKEYKKRGGKYRRKSHMRFSRKRGINKHNKTGLSRWFAEEWIDVCKLPNIVPCGRRSAKKSKRRYPYCRPRYKITSKSPKSASTLSIAEIKKRCKQKRKSPYKRLIPTKSRKRNSKLKSRKRRSKLKSRKRNSKLKSRKRRSKLKSRKRNSKLKSIL